MHSEMFRIQLPVGFPGFPSLSAPVAPLSTQCGVLHVFILTVSEYVFGVVAVQYL